MAKKKSFMDYTSFGSKSAEWVLKNLPFVFFLGFLATIYIANGHYAERRIREILTLQKEVKDMKREYNSLKSEIMFNSRYSEISKRVKDVGLERPKEPYKIKVND
jgi:cell division protein FtsL